MLKHLPADTGMAFVIVQHLSPKYKSLMQDILTKDTSMPVLMAESGMAVEPDHIYLIPPARNLTIKDYRLELTTQSEDRVPPFVIDLFFHALGNDVGAKSIGIILSGTGSDGSRGIRTIKEAGGTVIVQAPQSSEFDGMTISAIRTHLADFVLAPADIAKQLVQLAKAWSSQEVQDNSETETTTVQEGEPTPLSPVDQTLVNQILRLVQRSFGTDFSLYKPATIIRRMDKAIKARQLESYQAYYEGMVKYPEWRRELFHEMLIGVTSFFRDKEAFEILEQKVIPDLLEGHTFNEEVRIWVCGCSTGEEAYSVAMLLREYGETHNLFPKFKILATDINDKSLAFASRGEYEAEALEGLSPARKERFFRRNRAGNYEIKKKLRDRIIFARNDATQDPPFINLDLVLCRNLLIYLQPSIQRRLLMNFHFGLRTDGYLILGASENVLDMQRHFVPVSERWKVFQAKGAHIGGRQTYTAKQGGPEPRSVTREQALSHAFAFRKRGSGTNIRGRLQEMKPKLNYSKLLLRHYAPASILLDWEYHLLLLSGHAHEYLTLPKSEPSTNVFDMISTHVGIILRDAWDLLKKDPIKPLVYNNVDLERRGKSTICKLLFQTIPAADDELLVLIEIQEQDRPAKPEPPQRLLGELSEGVEGIIRGLQEDLHLAEMEVQNVMEELETSNEELQASNEELLASNEELQSTNEELQSLNEELHTVNTELQTRNEQITEAKATIDKMLQSTQLGTLFLDEEMRVRLFTVSVRDIFPLTEQDMGRPITQFANRLEYPNLIEDTQRVLGSGEIIQHESRHQDGRWFLVRHTPFRKEPDLVGGVVLTFMDVTERRMMEASLAQNEQLFRSIVETTNDRISVISPGGKLLFANWTEEEDIIGSSYFLHITAESLELAKEVIQKVVSEKVSHSFIAQVRNSAGKERWYSKNLTPLLDDGEVARIAIVGRDITSQVEMSSILGSQVATFQEFMDQSPMLAWIKDDKFRYVYVNRAYRDNIEIKAKDFIGHTDFDLYEEDIALQYRDNDKLVLEGGKVLYAYENVRQPDQHFEHMISMKFPLFVETNKAFIAGIGVDISDLKRSELSAVEARGEMERLVNARTEKVQQASEELKSLTRAIAHDLHPPIEAIIQAANVLQEQASSGNKPAKIIQNQAQRMRDLVQSLHHFVRLDQVALTESQIDMKALMAECYEGLAYLYEGRKVGWQLGDMPDITGDKTLLYQVITNLLSNALKFGQSDRDLEIAAGGEALPEEGMIRYWIKDNGRGIPAGEEDKAFGMFERLGTGDDIPGHGIGLSTVRRAIEMLGGRVWIESESGVGTTVFFVLPYLPET